MLFSPMVAINFIGVQFKPWQLAIRNNPQLSTGDGKGFSSKSNYSNTQMASLEQEKYMLFRKLCSIWSMIRVYVLVEQENKHVFLTGFLNGATRAWKRFKLPTTILFIQQYDKPNKTKASNRLTGPLWRGLHRHKGPRVRKAVQCHDVVIDVWCLIIKKIIHSAPGEPHVGPMNLAIRVRQAHTPMAKIVYHYNGTCFCWCHVTCLSWRPVIVDKYCCYCCSNNFRHICIISPVS